MALVKLAQPMHFISFKAWPCQMWASCLLLSLLMTRPYISSNIHLMTSCVIASAISRGGTYDPSQEAGPSQMDPPLAVPSPSSLQGRIQAEPASQVEPVGKGKVKAPSTDDQVAPDFGMEDEITSAGIYDNIPMVINTAVQGTLFPEFMGCENPYRVLCLGQGKDGVRMILFVRVNNNLYTYSDERLGTALANIHQGTPPPVPTRQHFTGPVTRWDRGIMGPIGLINTAEDIHLPGPVGWVMSILPMLGDLRFHKRFEDHVEGFKRGDLRFHKRFQDCVEGFEGGDFEASKGGVEVCGSEGLTKHVHRG
ncbi:hypothetical protein EDD17DRAFT_1510443 [Pisolithus thermaeus]|nr:hypothetical protein EDD17DRAFT_1510443 [Pisolithus thermaeus]